MAANHYPFVFNCARSKSATKIRDNKKDRAAFEGCRGFGGIDMFHSHVNRKTRSVEG